ncbi:RNA-binding domain-containing protein [Polyplosphaeria fusca]|uniref:RNA-binding domain-containing protein n=1 Tax=Polyplosphaeria fusca TaxID=682080 RepID=A0A9P4QK00_9PLEO|nr:RNA-binding domain-containing protein [Polyplosphaeria fusca]
MPPHRKRQRLSTNGAAAVTALAEAESTPGALDALPNDETVRKQNLNQRRTLFVRSLAPKTTTEDLTECFSENYPIKHAVAVLDPTTKQCKGFGFVTFADAEDAQRAKDELNGAKIQGKKIVIEVAEPRHRDLESDVPGHKRSVPSAAATEAKAKREQERKEQQPPKLIIRNLPWSIKTPEDLTKLFLSYGKIKVATLPKKPSGELKGFGFVTVRGKKNAERALQGVNGKEVDGRTLAVDWAVDKETWQKTQDVEVGEEAPPKKDDVDTEDASGASSDAESSELSEDEDDVESDSDMEDSNTDYEDISDDETGGIKLEEEDDAEEEPKPKSKSDPNTLFVRNIPFSIDDDALYQHFTQFGRLRYARIVLDHETERPKGTGFVSFIKEEDAITCLKGVPRIKLQKSTADKKDGTTITITRSILEDEDADPTRRYTMDGRVLQISLAVDKNEATRLTAEGHASRFARDKDKRRLYLLSEGTISTTSPLYKSLSPSELALRDASAKQRQKLIQTNPSLHLSLTRLSVRNIPRSITSKSLKELARAAIVGFASDVKANKRQKLSKEELARNDDADFIAEKMRKRKGKGIVKQAKIVFESDKGSKVDEASGAGRSRGYGFIEYYTHRNALMALRWLNGHAVDYKVKGEPPKGSKQAQKEALEDRKKRLIVEFAIENANVVARREDRGTKVREPHDKKGAAVQRGPAAQGNRDSGRGDGRSHGKGKKRKRDGDEADVVAAGKKGRADADTSPRDKDKGKGAKREIIIRRKREARRARKAAKG